MEYPKRFKDCAVDLSKLLEIIVLPEGLRVKDWTNGEGEYRFTTADTPHYDSACFLITQMYAIERISDGKTCTFEVTGLKDGEEVPRLVRLYEVVRTIDKAIASLEQ